jgi:hypothetical protein
VNDVMTQLSRIEPNSVARQERPAPTSNVPLMTVQDVWEMANYVAEAKCFPVATPQQAFALFMLAQSKGLHPMAALERYHVMSIAGRAQVNMKAAAIQAEFQARGGRIEPTEDSPTRQAAIFSHPLQPKPREYEYTMREAQDTGDAKRNPNYQTRPRDMLWARLVSRACNRIDPGIKTGIMSDVEAEDAALEAPTPAPERPVMQGRMIVTKEPTATNVDTMKLPGQHDADGFDGREYRDVVIDGVKAVNVELAACGAEPLKSAEIHRHLCLRAINAGHHPGPPPATANAAIPIIVRLYRDQREWVRSELGMFFLGVVEQAREEVRLREEAKAGQADEEPGDPPDDILPREPGSDG